MSGGLESTEACRPTRWSFAPRHDEDEHWTLAEVGDGWVRFLHPGGGEVFAQFDQIVLRQSGS